SSSQRLPVPSFPTRRSSDLGQEAPIAELVRVLAGANDRRRHQPRIALLPALGSITMNAEGPFGSASGITAQAMTKTLRKLREDRDRKSTRLNSSHVKISYAV